MLEKMEHILSNDGLIVIYHGRKKNTLNKHK